MSDLDGKGGMTWFGMVSLLCLFSTVISDFLPVWTDLRRASISHEIPSSYVAIRTHGHDIARAPGEFDPAATCQDMSMGTDREKTDL